MGYSPPKGRSPTCYSPVRHSHAGPKPRTPVRLACLIRAASVRSEPGSNSPSYIVAPYSEEQRAASYSLILFSFKIRTAHLSHSRSLPLSSLPSLFVKNTARRRPPPPFSGQLPGPPAPVPFTAFKEPHLTILSRLHGTPEAQERIYFTQICYVKYLCKNKTEFLRY